MKTFNGGSISNLVKGIIHSDGSIYVTDTEARAIRYANAQATKEVNPAMDQEQAEGTVILTINATPQWLRRPQNHPSLDHCEAVVRDYEIISARIRFSSYAETVYGFRNRYENHMMDREGVIRLLAQRGIIVEVIS